MLDLPGLLKYKPVGRGLDKRSRCFLTLKNSDTNQCLEKLQDKVGEAYYLKFDG